MLFNDIYIHETGGIYHTLKADEELTPLRPLVAEVCTQRYRRIDRFIQLALIGSGRCLKNNNKNAVELSEQTALYLTSGQGPTSNNIDVQESIFKHGEQAKPLQFINTLSNSAGFYVMKEAGLTGQNIFVTREITPFECTLQTAIADLSEGYCHSALIGIVDEATLPIEDQCLRMKLPEATDIGEGSYWFVLSTKKNNAQGKIDGLFIEDGLDEAINIAFRQTQPDSGKAPHVFIGRHMSESFEEDVDNALTTKKWEQYTMSQSVWDGINSAAVSHFISEVKEEAVLWVVSEDREGRVSILVVSSFNSEA